MATAIEPLTNRGLTERPAWKSLEAHAQKARALHLRDLFANDRDRGKRFTAEAAGIYLDYSKNRITDETIQAAHSTRGGIRSAAADRGHVPGREDQPH